MKASRPTKVITNAAPPELPGVMGVLRRQASNILTLVLVLVAIAMLIRWRLRTAEISRQAIGDQLMKAQNEVTQIRDLQYSRSPAVDLLKRYNFLQTSANSAISNVLNGSEDPQMRAQAFIARGDLYWYLANLPPLTGSTTQPSLALNETSDAMLQRSWEAYQEVLKNSTYADQHQALDIAHLGVGAIAENRAKSPADWAAARTEYEAVVKDPKALSIFVTIANAHLEKLPALQDKLYLAPVEGTAAAVVTTMPTTTSTTAPSDGTSPTTQSMTLPTTLPMTSIIQGMAHPLTTMPTTMPSPAPMLAPTTKPAK